MVCFKSSPSYSNVQVGLKAIALNYQASVVHAVYTLTVESSRRPAKQQPPLLVFLFSLPMWL